MEVFDGKVNSGNKLGLINQLEPDEIEKITVKPSTELIPDEYKHEDNTKGLVLIFYSSYDEENMKMLKQALLYQAYDVPDDNIYEITTKEFVLESLKKVSQDNHQDKTCFILIFMGQIQTDGRFLPEKESNLQNCIQIRDIWSLFTSDCCSSLRNVPKIFIFQALKQLDKIQFYSRRILNENLPSGAYEIPAEADMLLIYKKIDVPWARNNFIQQFSNNLYYDGHKDDIIGLVTHTDDCQQEKRPIIISTLTRKFYIKASTHRGHHHDLYKNHDIVTEKLEEVKEKIVLMEEEQSG